MDENARQKFAPRLLPFCLVSCLSHPSHVFCIMPCIWRLVYRVCWPDSHFGKACVALSSHLSCVWCLGVLCCAFGISRPVWSCPLSRNCLASPAKLLGTQESKRHFQALKSNIWIPVWNFVLGISCCLCWLLILDICLICKLLLCHFASDFLFKSIISDCFLSFPNNETKNSIASAELNQYQ